jgi:hypothetical protein
MFNSTSYQAHAHVITQRKCCVTLPHKPTSLQVMKVTEHAAIISSKHQNQLHPVDLLASPCINHEAAAQQDATRLQLSAADTKPATPCRLVHQPLQGQLHHEAAAQQHSTRLQSAQHTARWGS